MPEVILNQYRRGSSYKDQVGFLYHFPRRYLKRLSLTETRVIYYEPRAGGDQVYFGYGRIGDIWKDPEDPTHHYAEILDYVPFSREVSYYRGAASPWEPWKSMRNSVRRVSRDLFEEILSTGGLDRKLITTWPASATDLEEFYAVAKPTLRRYLAKRYERPNTVSKLIKESRGPTCQICGFPGFVMRNGRTYCEVHHLFHVARRLPGTLGPKHLIVVCATCHRKLHYGRTTDPVEKAGGWVFNLDGKSISITIRDP